VNGTPFLKCIFLPLLSIFWLLYILIARFAQRVTVQLHFSITWIAVMASRSNVFKKSWKSVDQGQQWCSNGHFLNHACMPTFIDACHMWAGWVLLDITIDVILVSK